MEVFLDHLKGERSGALDRFTKDVIRVGRNAEFELCFDDLGVSFEHAELRIRDGDFWLVDRGSTNGSYVNEERAYNARLRDGDVVRFGKKGPVVRFTLTPPRPEESAASRAEADAAEAARADSSVGEPLADLPPLAAAPEDPIGVPQKKVRSRRLTVPSMPSLEPQPPLERAAPEPPRIAVRPLPEPESSSADSLSSGGSSSLEERRAGERRIAITARPQTRGFWFALASLSVCTVFFAGAATMFYIESDRKAHLYEEARHDLETKSKELEDFKKDKADADQESQGREARAQEVARRTIENLEVTLSREREEAKKNDRSSRQKIEDLQQELARAQGELRNFANASTTGGGDGRAWKMIQKRLARSVVLVAVTFNLKKKDGTTEPKQAFGSGFFISKEGHIITNKHVVEPWKFRPMATQIAQDEAEVDPKSYTLSVWIAGTRFASGSQIDVTTGYSTQQGTLQKLRTPRDIMTSVTIPGDKSRTVLVHNDNSNEDLALLKATGGPFDPIPLRRPADGPVEKLDQVMVLGFPAGPTILEKGIAETSPSLGQVRKVEETIYVNASIIGGNSGGPVVDAEGRVIGVATRIVNASYAGTEALGICLKVEHVIDLFDNGN